MRKRTVKLWRLHEDGRKLAAGTIEATDPRELVMVSSWPRPSVASTSPSIAAHS